jgi:predicted solute-binding protein
MTLRKRLGVPAGLFWSPLLMHLAEENLFDRRAGVPAHHALQLRAQELDAALLTPVDYARDSSALVILPGVGVSSRDATSSIILIFRDALHTVATVAIDPSSASEIVLTKILLAEQFDLEPRFVPAVGPIQERLERADAALVVGDLALNLASRYSNRIDLVEAWTDMTDLPYVHGIWCATDGALNADDAQALRRAGHRGAASLDALAANHVGPGFPGLSAPDLSAYLHAFSYSLTDEDLDGFAEFLRYSFYHGVVPDVAELRFLDEDGSSLHTDDPPSR